MGKIIFISILTTAIISPAFALANGNHTLSLEDVLGEILVSQGVDEAASINCKEVTDEQLEELGEAVMSVMHPDERQHELMDQMMGGEGSQSLIAAHILMGENYLGCSQAFSGGMMNTYGGMMGGGMMGNWSGMMENWLDRGMVEKFNQFGILGWFGLIFMVSFWVLVVIVLILLIQWLAKQNKKQ